MNAQNQKAQEISPQKPKKGILRLLELSGEKKTLLIFSSLLSSLAAICQFVPYFAGYYIVQEFILNAYNLGNVDKEIVFWCAFIAIASVLVAMVLNGITFTLSHFGAYRILYNLRLRLARHLASLPLGYFTHHTKGQIHKTLQENVEKIENFVAHKIPEFIQSVIGASALFVIFLMSDWRLGLVCVATYIVAICVQFSTYGKSKEEMKRCLEQYFDKLESINASSIEFVKGISVVKMFGKSISSFQDFAKSIQQYHHFTLGFTYKCMRPFGIFSTLVNGFILFTLPFCAYFITRDTFNLYDILLCVFFILLSNGLIAPFLRLFNLSGELMQISEGVERIDKIFGQKPLPQSQNPKKPTRFDIAFESVDFAYTDSSGKPYAKNALKGVSFTLKEGESLAIVGKSGSGKSSVLRLLGRFYEPSSGAIKIGNANEKASLKNIAWLEIESLMGKFSMVFQNPYLFGGSVKSNVAFGKKDASDEEIREALKSANALEFVNALPYGIDTEVSESGASLSGGEKQRISIARCNLKNSPIILLDEITSSLDVYNEFAMQRALNRLAKDKTVIIIAHKLKSVMNCDKIVFLKNGKIVESGTHTELLALKGEYAKMWSAQNLG